MFTISEIKRRVTPICRKYGVKSLSLFGSYARGEATEKSDLDFYVEAGRIQDLFQLSAFRIELVEALGLSVNLVTAVPEDKAFRENLKKDRKDLYAA